MKLIQYFFLTWWHLFGLCEQTYVDMQGRTHKVLDLDVKFFTSHINILFIFNLSRILVNDAGTVLLRLMMQYQSHQTTPAV